LHSSPRGTNLTFLLSEIRHQIRALSLLVKPKQKKLVTAVGKLSDTVEQAMAPKK
jgi:hypothetical protein